MTSRKQGTSQATVKIDISPGGITISFEAIDQELADLISSAGEFVTSPVEHHTYDSSNLTLKTKKVLRFVDPDPEEIKPI